MTVCRHKIMRDFSVVLDGERFWTCSNCGKRERWSPSWSYDGTIECKECGWAKIYSAACSKKCVKELAA